MENEKNEGKFKIFGIGLSRTGTKSLTRALEILGFNIAHYPIDRTTYKELCTGNYNFSLLQEVDGITDITVSPFYAQLDALFPQSRFILTLRNKESWLTSMENHYHHNPMPRLLPDILIHQKIRRLLRAAVYGTYTFNKDRMSYVYDTHYRQVLQYFKGRENKLLVINIPAGEGWEKLCPFLGLHIQNQPFPKI